MELTDNQFPLKNVLNDLIPCIAMQFDCTSIARLKGVCKKYNTLCDLEKIIRESPVTVHLLLNNRLLKEEAFAHYARQNEEMFNYLWTKQSNDAREDRERMVRSFCKEQQITVNDARSVYKGNIEPYADKLKRKQKIREDNLIACVERFDRGGARLLLMNNTDPNLYNEEQDTILWRAVKRGCVKITRLLIQYGADVNKQNQHYPWLRPLHAAAIAGDKELTAILLSKGALVNGIDSNSETALHKACFAIGDARKYRDVVRCLLWHGANIDAKDYWGRTPLNIACCEGHSKMAHLLLKRGASTTIGNNPRFGAYCCGHKKVIQLLDDYGVPPCTEEQLEYYGKKVMCYAIFTLLTAPLMVWNNCLNGISIE